jgi:lipopolysaccharide/colanic/teichoic acid biosynthesis glycosyltransferase
MSDAWDENGVLLPKERRLTRIGSLVRSSSLDELLEVFRTTLKAAAL